MDVTGLSREQAREWYRKVLGPPMRKIVGDEYNELMVLFALLSPVSVSNNQRTETIVYHYHGQVYHLTYGLSEYPTMEVVVSD